MRAPQGLWKPRKLWSVLTIATILPWLMTAGPVRGHEPGSPPRPTTARLIPGRLGPSPIMRLPDRQQADRDATVADLTAALQTFTASLTEAQRQQLLFALDGPQRTTSRDPKQTPAFCAVLAWCVPGWGLSLGTLSFEQRMAFEAFLRAALGPSGYETVAAVRNRQHLIGALETTGNTQAIDAAETLTPGRSFADLSALAEALQAGGHPLSREALESASIGGLNPGAEHWRWTPPGMEERWKQFEHYAVAIFGTPGDKAWAIRLEGHHLSINLTVLQDGTRWQVHGTPLFLGAFPIIVPPPVGATALDNPLTWQQGQQLGLGLTGSLRRFWLAVPDQLRRQAKRGADGFPQRPPLANETPAAPMLTALAIRPDAGLIDRGPHVDLPVAQLTAAARRHLTALYTELLATLHPAVAASYHQRLEGAVRTGRLRATWAGGDLADPGSQHFTSIAVGPFLVELLQTPQYSVASPRVPWSNHLHVMLRDLASPLWGDPLGDHLRASHAPASDR
jgi:hypothetical protein